MTEDKTPTTKQLAWSIKGRHKNQLLMLRLYELRSKLDKKEDKEHFKELVAITFSLWRAVFLADRQIENKTPNAIKFAEKILIDNAIGFPQDRTNRAWSFYYYKDNAYYRILQFTDQKDQINQKDIRPTDRNRPIDQWETLHEALKWLIEKFEEKLSN